MNKELELIAQAKSFVEKETGARVPMDECCTLSQAEELMEVLAEWVDVKIKYCKRC